MAVKCCNVENQVYYVYNIIWIFQSFVPLEVKFYKIQAKVLSKCGVRYFCLKIVFTFYVACISQVSLLNKEAIVCHVPSEISIEQMTKEIESLGPFSAQLKRNVFRDTVVFIEGDRRGFSQFELNFYSA